jgi:hypothetical protein
MWFLLFGDNMTDDSNSCTGCVGIATFSITFLSTLFAFALYLAINTPKEPEKTYRITQTEYNQKYINLENRVQLNSQPDKINEKDSCQVLEIKHINIIRTKKGYVTEIDTINRPTELYIWKYAEGTMQDHNKTGEYGFSEIEPYFFLSSEFIQQVQKKLYADDSSRKIIGTDYLQRGIWLESVLFVEDKKTKKLDTLMIESIWGDVANLKIKRGYAGEHELKK